MTHHLRAVLSAPNVQAFTYTSAGSTYTIYRSTPGDTAPRMQCVNSGGYVSDWGAIVEPERFGPVGESLTDFDAWCRRFLEGGKDWGGVVDSDPIVTECPAASIGVRS